MGMLTIHFVCQSVDDEAVPPLQLIISLDSDVCVCLCVLCKLIFLFSSFVNWQIDIVYGMAYPHADWPLYESSISVNYEKYKKCFPENTMHDNKWSR